MSANVNSVSCIIKNMNIFYFSAKNALRANVLMIMLGTIRTVPAMHINVVSISNNFEIDSHDNFDQSNIYVCDFHHDMMHTLIFTKLLTKFTP